MATDRTNLREQFTPSELSVLGLVALGKTNREIAGILHISIATAKSQIHNEVKINGTPQ
jgi:DNA-binding CsgD family transcriptional regulator